MIEARQAVANHTVLPRRVLTDDVYEALLALLMSGDIPPGERASIDALARDLGVSATPIREALVRLEAEGLVVKAPLKGYSASPLLDAAGFRDLFEMRLLLEPAAARLAGPHLGPVQLEQLEESVAAMRVAVSASEGGARFEDYRAFADADAYFHSQLAQASGNPLVADAIGRLRAHTHLYRLHYSHGLAEQTAGEHQRVVVALREKSFSGAELAMREHIERSRDRFLSRAD